MSDNLVLTVDCAFPFDYSQAPPDTVCVLGYVGQHLETPHVWTADEIAAARHAIGAWAPIWTPPQGVFGQTNGAQASNGMRAALEAMDYSKDGPVFLDIEHSTWAADPARTMEGVHAWQAGMTAGGWASAHPYLPAAANYGWAANWTGVRPTSLPDTLVGQQFQGNADGGKFDLSVFRADVFAPLLQNGSTDVAALDSTDKAWLTQQLGVIQTDIVNAFHRTWWDNVQGQPLGFSLADLVKRVESIQAELGKLSTGGVDPSAIAAQLADTLGPKLAADVATELSKRLSA